MKSKYFIRKTAPSDDTLVGMSILTKAIRIVLVPLLDLFWWSCHRDKKQGKAYVIHAKTGAN